MSIKGTNKAGFRTSEMESLEYQRQFFYRFLRRFPEALEELKELLPLFELVFGKPSQISEYSDTLNIRLFYSRYLLAPDELLLNYCSNQSDYLFVGQRRRKSLFPEDIQLPADHPNKSNEKYYKSVIEASLLSRIAELKVDGGDTWLNDLLKKQGEITKKMELIGEEVVQKIYTENQIEVDDSQIAVEAKIQVKNLLEEHKFYDNNYCDTLLNCYWSFYQKFHVWLEKYYLQTHWLRRSFFIALCRGLKVVVPDIGTSIQFPLELQNELYGVEREPWYLQRGLPSPEIFIFDITEHSSDKHRDVTFQKKWKVESFSLFYTPPQYKAQQVEKFRQYLNTFEVIKLFELFELEGHILDAFSVFIDGTNSNENRDNRQKLKNEFREHLWKFHVFKNAVEERNKILISFEQHIDNYLDTLLPKIKKYYPTKAGKPHNFEQIEWLLSWNVKKSTTAEIFNDFALKGDEAYIHKAFANLKRYDLPVRTKRNRKNEKTKIPSNLV